MSEVMIITGTRKGIGRYLVDYYLALGFTVVGCSRQKMEEEILGYEHYCLDVAHEEKVQTMIQEVAEKYGQIDILVNNAGIASMNHVLMTPKVTLEKILSTNVIGTFLFAREAAKIMMRKKYGRIVNFATVAAPLKLEGEAIYAASKAAIRSLTEIMAKELAPYHITVNALGPTPVATDLIRSVPKDKIEALINLQSVKRMGVYEDISNVIDFFIHRKSEFVTGQTIYLGGIS